MSYRLTSLTTTWTLDDDHHGHAVAWFLTKSIRAEKAIDELMDAHHFDVIISNNGCWSAKATSVMITTSWCILLSFPWNWASGISARLLKHLLRPFDHIWIPDLPDGILTRVL